MKKFLAVVKREYMQRVRAKMFIVSPILLPLVMSLFGIVPAVILSIDAGSPMRVAVSGNFRLCRRPPARSAAHRTTRWFWMIHALRVTTLT